MHKLLFLNSFSKKFALSVTAAASFAVSRAPSARFSRRRKHRSAVTSVRFNFAVGTKHFLRAVLYYFVEFFFAFRAFIL